jgi:hypothetical protein
VIEITVAVVVADGDQRLVNIGRTETVLPAVLQQKGGEVAEVDLTRATLDRLVAEVSRDATDQVEQLRRLMETAL